MFFVPEPKRNETNRLAALEEQAKADADIDKFDHLALKNTDQDESNANPEVSNLSLSF